MYERNHKCIKKSSFEKPEGKKSFERPRHRWKNNIKYHKQIACGMCGLDSSGSG
jgi:hypothetical protein